jgi:hypothetical protein
VVLYAVFGVVAAAVLALPLAGTGVEVLALVVGYQVAVVWLARTTRDTALWTAWTVLAPMSVLMVLPDWFLSEVLRSLDFPDTGAPFIGAVPVFMAGMWTIALIPVVMLGLGAEAARGAWAGFAAASGAGLVLFAAAEYLAPVIPLWQPVGVARVGEVATYVLLPEIGLCLAAYALVRGARSRSRWASAAGVVAVPFLYTGMLAVSYQFLA